MRSAPRLFLCCLTFVIITPLAAPAAEGGLVEAEGEATIRDGDLVAARKTALTEALRSCLEKVVGVQVQSEFTAEQREVVEGKRDEFYSAVRDTLTQKVEGFIKSYEVLSERQQGAVLRLTVRAEVYESKVRAKAQELAELIVKAGNPKLMLVIQELHIDEHGTPRVIEESTVAAFLEKELLARGFELRGDSAAQAKVSSQEAYESWSKDPAASAALARREGADILICGRVEIISKGVVEKSPGFDALVGQTKIELRSVVRGQNANTGDVFSAKPVLMASFGTTLERAVHRALQGRGQNAIKQTLDQLLEDLRKSFEKAASSGQSYVVSLHGIKSFRKQGQAFLDGLAKIKGVAKVHQRSFVKGSLMVDLDFTGSLGELEREIFATMTKHKAFADLDLDGTSGKQLDLRL